LGHDAVYLVSNGFRVTALDISKKAVSMLRKRIEKLGLDVDLIVGDVLRDGPTDGEFDYIFERSVLQTLPPTKRAHYVLCLTKILKPTGEYIGIIRGPRTPMPESQPYAFTRNMIEQLLSAHSFSACKSRSPEFLSCAAARLELKTNNRNATIDIIAALIIMAR
jgi:SAM-dependent methyltransferase